MHRQHLAAAETTPATGPGHEPADEPPPWLLEPPTLERAPDATLPEPPGWLDEPAGESRPDGLDAPCSRSPGARPPAPRPRGGEDRPPTAAAARASAERSPRFGPP